MPRAPKNLTSNRRYLLVVDLDQEINAVVTLFGPRGRNFGRVDMLHLSAEVTNGSPYRASMKASGRLKTGRWFDLSRLRVIGIQDGISHELPAEQAAFQ